MAMSHVNFYGLVAFNFFSLEFDNIIIVNKPWFQFLWFGRKLVGPSYCGSLIYGHQSYYNFFIYLFKEGKKKS